MGARPRPLVLVIDDQDNILRFCRHMLAEEFEFLHATHAEAARRTLVKEGDGIAGVILDRDFSKVDPQLLLGPVEDAPQEGLHILRWLHHDFPGLPVLMVTGHRDQRAALEAAELQTDYLVWGDVTDDPEILRAMLRRSLQLHLEETQRIMDAFHRQGVVGDSPAFARALVTLYQVVRGGRPILILGETGTGKDLLARAVHALAGGDTPSDHVRPFVNVNIAALNPSLIESELFGHKRGAYTGAEEGRLGKLRLADGGTLFLNEIADLSSELQVKLLTVLEEHEVVPVGEDQSFPARFRLVAATSRDLRQAVVAGSFRKDLFYRLAWNTVEIPSLRDRRDDIPLLIQHFLHRTNEWGHSVTGMTDEAGAYLAALDWGGNVRQLEAVIDSASLSAEYIVTLLDVKNIAERQDFNVTGKHAGAPVNADGPVGESEPAVEPEDRSAPDVQARREEERVFGDLTYRELTMKYFSFLYRKTGGHLPQLARQARISKATAYTWARKFGKRPGNAEPDAS